MKAPVRWVAEFAALPEGLDGRGLGEVLIRAGLEVETVARIGGDVVGPVVIGRVVSSEPVENKGGKSISYNRVDVGPEHNDETGSRGIICGAPNVVVGEHVIVALPGSTLPGGFEIGARQTYGRLSDGMICAADELGIGDDHSGIINLGPFDDSGEPWVLGADALTAIGVRDDVLDIAVTPDMGYCLSIRGLAREAAQALKVDFADPIAHPPAEPSGDGFPVKLQDPACPLFVALTVEGIDPARPSPRWLANRLAASGMRSISLAVDISNYVMLETGQPNHCYDADALRGAIVVRRAKAGEGLLTLDGVQRKLDPEDLLICDDSGPIGLAGVMGGGTTELTDKTSRVVIEAANFDPVAIARTSRRHRLSSEASRRFERGVDPAAAYGAARRVAQLLVDLAGGRLVEGETVAGALPEPLVVTIPADLPARILGVDVSLQRVLEIFEASGIGSAKAAGGALSLTPPSWRPDLRDPYDFVEEVGCKVGLELVPSIVPRAPVGRGFTAAQQARRAVTAAVARAGFVEVLTFPFAASEELDRLGVPAGDGRRALVRLSNPLAETQPFMRTTLLPGLFGAVQRNTSRGNEDLALFEVGSVFLAGPSAVAPLPDVAGRPTEAELAQIEAALPAQPRHIGAILTGAWTRAGWARPAQEAGWAHAFGFADVVAGAIGLGLRRVAVTHAPYHPGRCAALFVGDTLVGHAGELHPDVCRSFGLPPRAAAAELDLSLLLSVAPGPGVIAPVSTHPVAKEDVALVVADSVSAGDVEAALRDGAGVLLESLWLFDVYTGAPIPAGHKSLAFALRFRAPDRTLTEAETAAAKAAAVAEAARRHGAVQRA